MGVGGDTVHFTIAEPGGIDTNFATSSMSLLAKHPAYDAPDSPSRVMAAYIDNAEFRKSWSRPENMAKAILELVSSGQPIPMRFPLGAISWQVLREEVDRVAKDFDNVKALSISVDSVDQAEQMERVKGLV